MCLVCASFKGFGALPAFCFFVAGIYSFFEDLKREIIDALENKIKHEIVPASEKRLKREIEGLLQKTLVQSTANENTRPGK